ncbi:hypothetical protein GAYE_SCF63G6662 [Galdieria yellowstonensis]|uniref:Small ribosomal subunit protein uS10 n=1 Tax=Galdieria yellowstonensis TaxID=3028027 RepID=A0AAV9IMH8_9RHOD|nr:hypothetical protein GAYE_SCF63G6662 [Galdieria yellowstonensis]
MATVAAAPPPTKKVGLETTETPKRIRITLTSKNLRAVEGVCQELVQRAKMNGLRVRGPVRMPRKTLRITTRKSPCGEGTNTWDRFELRIYKRVVDIFATADVVKQVTAYGFDSEVQTEVTISD